MQIKKYCQKLWRVLDVFDYDVETEMHRYLKELEDWFPNLAPVCTEGVFYITEGVVQFLLFLIDRIYPLSFLFKADTVSTWF